MTDTEVLAGYRPKLVAALGEATDQDIVQGLEWYQVHHDIVQSVSGTFHMPPDNIAAAMSCLSANTRWEWARDATIDLVQAHRWGKPLPTLPTVGRQAKKAIAVLSVDKRGRALLPHVATKVGQKTRSFYLNLLDPNDPEPVTLDRWMWRCVGRHVGTVRLYRIMAEAIREIAENCNLLPNQVQAIIWTVSRKRGKDADLR